MTGHNQQNWQTLWPTYGGNKSKERGVTNTGNSSQRSNAESGWQPSRDSSEGPVTPSHLDQTPLTTMFGRKTQQYPARDLNLVPNRCEGTRKPTGTECGHQPSKERSWISLPIYEYVVITPYAEYAQTMLSQLEWSDLYECTGVELVLASHAKLGTPRAWTLTVKTRIPSSGTDTLVRKLLSSMSFEEKSTSLTFCDGATGIRSEWKSKAQQRHY